MSVIQAFSSGASPTIRRAVQSQFTARMATSMGQPSLPLARAGSSQSIRSAGLTISLEYLLGLSASTLCANTDK